MMQGKHREFYLGWNVATLLAPWETTNSTSLGLALSLLEDLHNEIIESIHGEHFN